MKRATLLAALLTTTLAAFPIAASPSGPIFCCTLYTFIQIRLISRLFQYGDDVLMRRLRALGLF